MIGVRQYLLSYFFEKIFDTAKYPAFFLRFAAGIADKHFHDKTTNHDQDCCGLPGDWGLSRAVGADDVIARHKTLIDFLAQFRYDLSVAFTVLHN